MTIEFNDVPFFHDLTAAHLAAVKKCLIERSFDKGSILHSEGGACTQIFFVKAGRIKMYRTSSSGKEQIFEVLEQGDTCACNPGDKDWICESTAEAIVPSTVWLLSRKNYVKMVEESSTLMHALNDLFAKRLKCFGKIIEEITMKDTRQRLVRFLLDMLKDSKKNSNNQNVLFIRATREEIANRLGAVRETIARHISELKRLKLIDVKPYQIIIRDKEGLEKLLL